MTGILSLMANIYDVAIADIIANLNLNDEVAAALTDYGGHYGSLLRVMEHLEDLDTWSASTELTSMGIDPSNLAEIQLRAFNWRKSA
jgi:EAL and modified HD-GYP domain-containing signal transduction protein